MATWGPTQVTASTDDARDLTSGSFNATVVSQFIGLNSSNDYYSGLRWLNVTIPQSATIGSATLDMYSAGSTTGSTPFNGRILGIAADNVATFSSSNRPSQEPFTTSTVDHSFSQTTWTTAGFGVDAFDITGPIQEIINRAGWSSGNAIGVVIHNSPSGGATGTNDYVAFSTYDSNTTRGAKLTITYTTGSSSAVKQLTLLGVG